MAAETTNRRWWASLGAGALLCLGCCLAPLLIAAGIVGSGTLLVSLSWLEPLGFALIGLGTAGLIWTRIRKHRNNCRATDSAGGGSCASTGCACATASAGTPGSGIEDLRL